MNDTVARRLWVATGGIALGVGMIGVVVPLLPTTPFLILAAWCFSRGSRRLHAWLIGHRTFGPPVRDWREHRAISPKSKLSAVIAVALIFALSVVLQAPTWAIVMQGIVLAGVVVFLVTRPAPPKSTG